MENELSHHDAALLLISASGKFDTFVKIQSCPINADRLRLMPYEELLGTQYWYLIREVVTWIYSGRCVKCHRCASIDVHHKTYIHHGLEDLIALCAVCHCDEHGKDWERKYGVRRISKILPSVLRGLHVEN